MSAFLGPIHYWLYKKIQLVNDREQALYDKAAAMCGDTAEEVRTGIWQTYGEPPAAVDLAELIDLSNIHGWLQRQITLAEVREATLVRDLQDHCGEAALALAQETFLAQGAACGLEANQQGKYDAGSAAGIYAAMNDVRLNGMPCDQPDTMKENTVEIVSWESGPSLQAASWGKAGVDATVMAPLYRSWMEAFVAAMNPKYSLQQTADIAKGDAVNHWQISRK